MTSILTKRHLNRRTFLRGMGATLALPFLDAMVPAASAATRKAPVRLGFFYIPNGAIMEHWTPAAKGASYELPYILEPLAGVRDELIVASRLAHINATSMGDGGGDHARASAAFLTGVHPNKTAGTDIRAGVSVDQLAAEHLRFDTRFPSLELTLEPGRLAGSCDSGYSCAYSNSISWRTDHTPNPPEGNPRLLFERMFGGRDATLNADERAKRRAYRGSILDYVMEDASDLMGTLGATDRRKMDEYLHAVRQVERQIEFNEERSHDEVGDLELPASAPKNFAEYARLMFDLQILAYKTDQTRVTTMLIGGEGSNRAYNEVGVSGGHHGLSHHLGDEKKIADIREINRYHMEQFAYFLEQMKNTEDGEGSLLDNSLIVYGSGISDGNRHSHVDLPVIVAGRAGGQVKPGRHIEFAEKTPMTNLYLNALEYVGCPTDAVGDSTGKLNYLDSISA